MSYDSQPQPHESRTRYGVSGVHRRNPYSSDGTVRVPCGGTGGDVSSVLTPRISTARYCTTGTVIGFPTFPRCLRDSSARAVMNAESRMRNSPRQAIPGPVCTLCQIYGTTESVPDSATLPDPVGVRKRERIQCGVCVHSESEIRLYQ